MSIQQTQEHDHMSTRFQQINNCTRVKPCLDSVSPRWHRSRRLPTVGHCLYMYDLYYSCNSESQPEAKCIDGELGRGTFDRCQLSLIGYRHLTHEEPHQFSAQWVLLLAHHC